MTIPRMVVGGNAYLCLSFNKSRSVYQVDLSSGALVQGSDFTGDYCVDFFAMAPGLRIRERLIRDVRQYCS